MTNRPGRIAAPVCTLLVCTLLACTIGAAGVAQAAAATAAPEEHPRLVLGTIEGDVVIRLAPADAPVHVGGVARLDRRREHRPLDR